MLRWILALVLIWLVIRSINTVFRGLIEGMSGTAGQPPATPLARDPVCGMYVVPGKSLSSGSGAQMRFFCSENCRRIYQAKQGR